MLTLQKSITRCINIKEKYIGGEVSYNRAYKQLDKELRFAWQRYNTCTRLAEQWECADSCKLEESCGELKWLTDWANS